MRFLEKHHRTLIACALLLVLSAQRDTAMFAIIFALPLFIWFIYSIFVVCAKPERRAQQLVKVAIWVIALSLMSAIHWHRSETARHSADDIVLAVKQYKVEHHIYPANLEVIGRDSQQLKRELMLHYWFYDGKPTLLYASTIDPFDKYYYDFQADTWILHPD
ncbi:hypothetical protein [Paraherbaspirillum soli]|uniref:Uncharacterized protein n=1 Tax=Paraherbaspirillum soli TaxID=631222 RepID=A0ABW0MDX5_9BURK